MNIDDIKRLAENRAKTATRGTMPPIGDLSNGKGKAKLTPAEQVIRSAQVASRNRVENIKNRINLGYDDSPDPFFD